VLDTTMSPPPPMAITRAPMCTASPPIWSPRNDLVAGSGIHLTDRGVNVLKGVPDPWQLYSADV
jgi:hypothetical protein